MLSVAPDLTSLIKLLVSVALDELRWSVRAWLSDLRLLLDDLRGARVPDPQIKAAVAELIAAIDNETHAATVESIARVDAAIAQLRRAVDR